MTPPAPPSSSSPGAGSESPGRRLADAPAAGRLASGEQAPRWGVTGRRGGTTLLERPPAARARPRPEALRVDRELFLRDSGHHEAAGRILGAALVCFTLWTLFDANQLYNSALSSPEGARRTVSLTVVRPIAQLANTLHLSFLVNWGDHMLGRGAGTPGAGGYRFPTPVVVTPRAAGGGPFLAGMTPRPHFAGAGRPPAPAPVPGLPPLRQPTVAHPLTILDIGDSIGQDLGYGLGEAFTGHPSVEVNERAVESTGLARPDYYDWPAELQTYLRRDHPQAVVVMLGANDEQPLDENGRFVPVGSAGWVRDYRARVALLMEEAYGAGARTLWVGLPPMDSPDVSSGFARQVNAIFESQAEVHPDVTYVSTWRLLSGPGGRFSQYIRLHGNETQVRYPDGVHLTPEGWDLLGSYLVKPMEQAWGVKLP